VSTDSNDSQPISFDQLADLFVEQGALVSPAEVHGYLCGQLAAGSRLSPERWLLAAAEQLGVDSISVEGFGERLDQLHRQTLTELETHGFELQLLLPDEDQGVGPRAEGLGLWCHGFVAGYTLAGGPRGEGLSEDARDALDDFSQIAQIAADADDEESQADFEEVYEYVRMGALLLFSECNRAGAEQCAPLGTALH